jgi:hypothetical protein
MANPHFEVNDCCTLAVIPNPQFLDEIEHNRH